MFKERKFKIMIGGIIFLNIYAEEKYLVYIVIGISCIYCRFLEIKVERANGMINNGN